jgi:hypothetical protein
MGNPAGAPTSLASAGDFPADGGARFGTLSPGQTHYYRLTNTSGTLKARAHSYTLYSPVDVKVDLLDSSGNLLAGAVSVDDVQDPMPGGYVNYDSSAEAVVAGGDYYLRVRASPTRLYSSAFPAGFDLLDGSGHYLLSLSVDGHFGSGSTADMSACANVNNSTQTASFRAPASSSRERESGGGCGTLGSSGSPWGGGPLQLLLFAGLVHAFFLARRLKGALVRKRR